MVTGETLIQSLARPVIAAVTEPVPGLAHIDELFYRVGAALAGLPYPDGLLYRMARLPGQLDRFEHAKFNKATYGEARFSLCEWTYPTLVSQLRAIDRVFHKEATTPHGAAVARFASGYHSWCPGVLALIVAHPKQEVSVDIHRNGPGMYDVCIEIDSGWFKTSWHPGRGENPDDGLFLTRHTVPHIDRIVWDSLPMGAEDLERAHKIIREAIASGALV